MPAESGKPRAPLIPDDFEDDLLLVSVLGLIVCLFLSAIARHGFPEYHPALIEASAICLTWITTVGASRAAAHGMHVRIVYVADLAPPAQRRRMELFADIVTLLVALALFAISCRLAEYALTHPAPRGHPLVYASMPVGMGLMIYRLTRRVSEAWRTRT